VEIHVLVKVKDRSGDGNCGFVTYERQVLYARKRLNLEVEIRSMTGSHWGWVCIHPM